MKTKTKTQPAPVARATPDIHHIVCCDDDLALCGLDVSVVLESDGSGEQRCVVCQDLTEREVPCNAISCDFYGGLSWL